MEVTLDNPLVSTARLDDANQRHFGHGSFRPGQREVIEAVVAGHPVLAVMPTGAGKSLCYQLPAMLSSGTSLVVSPLIALMQDQVDALAERELPATFINSHVPPAERDRRLARACAGDYKLLYVAPERLRNGRFISALRGARLDRMIVDEAHCVSQWGHDFRPDYRELPRAARALGVDQLCAFTATATPEVRDDICELLGLDRARGGRGPEVFVHGFRRENLRMHVVPVQRLRDKIAHITALAEQSEEGSGIVYSATRKNVDKVATQLEERGLSVGRYHAGMSERERAAAQRAFMSGEARIMVATNAFGLGIDKPDTRFVAHHELPGSLEAYYQEAGRAGRDGLPADCVLFFNYADVHVQQFFIERVGAGGDPGPHAAPIPAQIARLQTIERAKLRRMLDYCYTEDCRQHLILRYFGEGVPQGEGCGACDLCATRLGEVAPDWAQPKHAIAPSKRKRKRDGEAKPREPVTLEPAALPNADQLVLVQKILSAYARSKGRLSRPRIIALLRGTGKEMPEDLAKSRSAGILARTPARLLQAVIEELVARGALRAVPRRQHVYVLAALGVSLLRGEAAVALSLPSSAAIKGRHSHNTSTWSGKPGAKPAEEKVLDADPALLEALRRWRLEVSREQVVPAYVVAANRVLERIAAARPRTSDELLAVKGVGQAKVRRYGEALLEAIRRHEGG